MKRGSVTTVIFLLVFFFLSGTVAGAVPWLIGYQGKVTDSEQALLNGYYPMIFQIYHVEDTTLPMWAEQKTDTMADDIFAIHLGAGAAH